MTFSPVGTPSSYYIVSPGSTTIISVLQQPYERKLSTMINYSGREGDLLLWPNVMFLCMCEVIEEFSSSWKYNASSVTEFIGYHYNTYMYIHSESQK